MTLSFENPILTKELRTRMRGARAFWVLFVFLAALSGILAVSYYTWWRNTTAGGDGLASFGLGRQFYVVLFVVQAALVGLIAPALTSGTLSVEREQRTFEALSVTVLPRRSIVLGKLASALAFVVLLLVASLPLTAVCFLLGGVSPQEIGAAYVLLTASAFLYGATGLAFSSFARTTTSATVLTYGTILLFFLVTLPMALPGLNSSRDLVSGFLSAVNPVGAMAAGTAQESYYNLTVPAWLPALTVNGLLGTILTLVALHRLEWPRSDRSGLLRGLTASFFGLISLLVCGYSARASYQGIDIAAMTLSVLPLLLTALFATAETLPADSPVAWFKPSRLRRGEAPSGLLFAFLTVLACHLLLFTVGNASGELFYYHTGLSTAGSAFLGVCQALATTFGLGVMGLLFTAKIGNRWGALGATLGVALLLYILPFGAIYSTYQMGSATQHGPWENLYYLTPVAGAGCLGGHSLGGIEDGLAFGLRIPPAAVTSGLYAFLGLALLPALAKARRRSG